jgi:serine/threonine-protein kinase
MTTGTASLQEDGGTFVGPVRPGDLIADKYRVEATLGVGGMGVVMAARDEVLERRVAIKFLQPRLVGTEIAVQRFVREARAATHITSEHVARLLEIGNLPRGGPYFVMEYLQGRDLRAVLREDGPLPPSVAVDYVLQALEAVAEGHLKGIVHRDLKPGNLFLTARADGSPLIKVLDFGIAKRLESYSDGSEALTSTEDVRLGSPAYMPPEQLQDAREVDTRSDIWSLGATLYELVCGKPPFVASDYLELVSRILTAPPAPIVGELSAPLQRVILRCLEKDRQRRFANAAELAEALAPLGSEDARTSVSRIAGLHASSATMAVTRNILEPAGSSSTTLPVARESSRPPPLAVEQGAGAKRGKVLLLALLGGALLALVIGVASTFGSSTSMLVRSGRSNANARSDQNAPRRAGDGAVADATSNQAASSSVANEREGASPVTVPPVASNRPALEAPRSIGGARERADLSAKSRSKVVQKPSASSDIKSRASMSVSRVDVGSVAPATSASLTPNASDETIQRLIQTRR